MEPALRRLQVTAELVVDCMVPALRRLQVTAELEVDCMKHALRRSQVTEELGVDCMEPALRRPSDACNLRLADGFSVKMVDHPSPHCSIRYKSSININKCLVVLLTAV
jgi:hypothetical protein